MTQYRTPRNSVRSYNHRGENVIRNLGKCEHFKSWGTEMGVCFCTYEKRCFHVQKLQKRNKLQQKQMCHNQYIIRMQQNHRQLRYSKSTQLV